MAQFIPPESNLDEGPPPRVAKRSRRWLLRGLAIVIALTAVTAAAAGIYVGSVSKSFTDNVQREKLLPSYPSESASPGKKKAADSEESQTHRQDQGVELRPDGLGQPGRQ